MSDRGVTGKILSIRPVDLDDHTAGFEVEVELITTFGDFFMTIRSDVSTLASSSDDVRIKLYNLGVDMAKAFQYSGSLK